MSGSAGSDSSESKRGVRLSLKQVVGLVVVVLAVVFAVQNTDSTRIEFFGAELDSPLWVWFVGLLALGVLVGVLLPVGRKKS